jgi:hypothetical protein
VSPKHLHFVAQLVLFRQRRLKIKSKKWSHDGEASSFDNNNYNMFISSCSPCFSASDGCRMKGVRRMARIHLLLRDAQRRQVHLSHLSSALGSGPKSTLYNGFT